MFSYIDLKTVNEWETNRERGGHRQKSWNSAVHGHLSNLAGYLSWIERIQGGFPYSRFLEDYGLLTLVLRSGSGYDRTFRSSLLNFRF